jgi:hypothetical protein
MEVEMEIEESMDEGSFEFLGVTFKEEENMPPSILKKK